MTSVDVRTSTRIARPREDVARFACDPDNVTRWYRNIRSVEWETSPPLRVGSRVTFVAEFLGRRLAYTYEVVELEPARRLVMRTAHGPFPMETTYAFEDSPGGGTEMTLRNRGTPSGFAGLGAPLLSAAMRRANGKDLAALRELLEAGA